MGLRRRRTTCGSGSQCVVTGGVMPKKTRPCSRCGDLRQVGKGSRRDIVCRKCRRERPEPSKWRPCVVCGTQVVSRGRKTCSLDCLKKRRQATGFQPVPELVKLKRTRERYRRKNHERRARLRDVTIERVDPSQVYERDAWRCHICGHKVRRDVNGLHQLGATLDHLIPLSRGGAHCYENVALAHRKCNTRKNAQLQPFQMLLIPDIGA